MVCPPTRIWRIGAIAGSNQGAPSSPGDVGTPLVAPHNVAVVYAGLGQTNEAFAWLNRAYDDRSYLLAIYLPTDARLNNLHSDSRFDQLRSRIGLPKSR